MFSTHEYESSVVASTRARSFMNPIGPGADPWVVRHGGFYYWCASDRDLGVVVYRSCSLSSFGERFVVWQAPASGRHSAQVWAPELHRLDGRWYIYVAASNGRNESHRMIVLESAGDDPTAAFHCKAELYTGDDFARRKSNRWAIDGTVLEHDGSRYFLWSGWQGARDEQRLYIARMSNPWTLSGARVQLCANNDHLWERVGETMHGRGLHEAPQVLKRNGRVYVVFSCSGSWEPSYKLGLLELAPHGEPLNPLHWRKHDRPVFESSADTFGVGHCCFTQSPDGTEDWLVYHAKVSRSHGWERVVHAQVFTWDASGFPCFGAPIGASRPLALPSSSVALTGRRLRQLMEPLIQDVQVIDTAGEASGEKLASA